MAAVQAAAAIAPGPEDRARVLVLPTIGQMRRAEYLGNLPGIAHHIDSETREAHLWEADGSRPPDHQDTLHPILSVSLPEVPAPRPWLATRRCVPGTLMHAVTSRAGRDLPPSWLAEAAPGGRLVFEMDACRWLRPADDTRNEDPGASGSLYVSVLGRDGSLDLGPTGRGGRRPRAVLRRRIGAMWIRGRRNILTLDDDVTGFGAGSRFLLAVQAVLGGIFPSETYTIDGLLNRCSAYRLAIESLQAQGKPVLEIAQRDAAAPLPRLGAAEAYLSDLRRYTAEPEPPDALGRLPGIH